MEKVALRQACMLLFQLEISNANYSNGSVICIKNARALINFRALDT